MESCFKASRKTLFLVLLWRTSCSWTVRMRKLLIRVWADNLPWTVFWWIMQHRPQLNSDHALKSGPFGETNSKRLAEPDTNILLWTVYTVPCKSICPSAACYFNGSLGADTLASFQPLANTMESLAIWLIFKKYVNVYERWNSIMVWMKHLTKYTNRMVFARHINSGIQW